ncbi:hypothetical protein EI427_20720 [Flammeovirga pectinis]|uniref:Uncharacterized protein n=1 Tax=Flammeovirga pectinis TaxID=2494373 RepID=A0A3S9P8X7_9BACT|nr:hypothetical protein [Flammeovirga pectinis]AZQ64650.1 hypothetical protein EI427_20720 [Flammeovirga pectinis]
MKNLFILLFALTFGSFFANAQENTNQVTTTETSIVKEQKGIQLYKELYTDMDGVEVHNYIINELKGKREFNGDYSIMFLEEEAFLKPIFENNSLIKIQVVFQNEDVEAVYSSLRGIEQAFNQIEEWDQTKTEEFVWLFKKQFEEKVNNKNELTIYSAGVFHDEIGHGWHATLQINPRLDETAEISDEELAQKTALIQSDMFAK